MESPSCDDLPGLYNQNPTKVRRKEDIKPIINSLLTRLGAILTNTILLHFFLSPCGQCVFFVFSVYY